MSRRKVPCPGCRSNLIVTPAAEERGRMRCPECGEVVDVPEAESHGERLRRLAAERAAVSDDDYDNGPPRKRRRREQSSGRLIGWVLGGLGVLALIICGGCIGVFVYFTGSEASPSPVPLMQARSGFRTKLITPQNITDGPAPQPIGDLAQQWQLIRYNSPAGAMAAYLTRDPGDGQKRPAVIWAHGGFGGVGLETLEFEPASLFADAGFVVMCPSWRGENDNPGKYEMFYGEVDDAVAAVEYVAKLQYVDPNRIYMVGHSTGGTITLLTVEATPKLRAAFSFGGAPDIGSIVRFGGIGYGNTPFDWTDKKERRLRSAIDYIHHVRTPTFYFEGTLSDDYLDDARRMEKFAQKAGAPVKVFLVDDFDHFELPEPICEMLVNKIKADRGPTCNIAITLQEVKQACDRWLEE